MLHQEIEFDAVRNFSFFSKFVAVFLLSSIFFYIYTMSPGGLYSEVTLPEKLAVESYRLSTENVSLIPTWVNVVIIFLILVIFYLILTSYLLLISYERAQEVIRMMESP